LDHITLIFYSDYSDCIFLFAAQVELRPAVDLGKSCVKEHGPHGEDHAMVLAEYTAFGVAHLDMSTSQSKCTQMIPNVFISIQG
jgi:hypothetical protein